MATFLVVETRTYVDSDGMIRTVHAGQRIDSEDYRLDRLQSAGVPLVPWLDRYEPIVRAYLGAVASDPNASLLANLLAATSVFPPAVLVGPWVATLAASQSDVALDRGGAVSFVALHAGYLTGLSAALSIALTGVGQAVDVDVRINGAVALSARFTQAGGEVELVVTAAGLAVAPGDVIDVVYTSGTISNTPDLSVDVEIASA